jgi:hypothetical protein
MLEFLVNSKKSNMVLKHSSDKITFIVDTIHSIGYETKGASIACHRLAYELANQGHYVYVFNEPLYPHENIEIIKTDKINEDDGWWNKFYWTPFGYNPERTVSIYTQITWGNPMNTIHNVRWVLHDYEYQQWETFGDNEYVCNFGTFKVPEGIKQNKLTIFDYKIDKFYDTNNPNRKGFGYLFHKSTPKWGKDFVKNFDATEIPHYNGKQSLEYLLEEFNKYEYVLTFDDKSYYTTAAALCGTKAIILNPDKDLTPNEYRSLNPIQMCGVAYGMNDIKWANETIGLVRNNLLELERKDKQTINNFIEFWKSKLG